MFLECSCTRGLLLLRAAGLSEVEEGEGEVMRIVVEIPSSVLPPRPKEKITAPSGCG